MAVMAVLDACVMYPIGLRDVLLEVAIELELYVPKWSEAILDEMERNLVNNGVTTTEKAAQLRTALDATFPDARVTGFEQLIPTMTNHRKDRHVLAAAVHTEAEIIVTSNLKDFRDADCVPHGVQAMHPSQFLEQCLDSRPHGVLEVVQGLAAERRKPPVTYEEFLSSLFASVPGFAGRLRTPGHGVAREEVIVRLRRLSSD